MIILGKTQKLGYESCPIFTMPTIESLISAFK
jgi:hypothetical protein